MATINTHIYKDVYIVVDCTYKCSVDKLVGSNLEESRTNIETKPRYKFILFSDREFILKTGNIKKYLAFREKKNTIFQKYSSKAMSSIFGTHAFLFDIHPAHIIKQ